MTRAGTARHIFILLSIDDAGFSHHLGYGKSAGFSRCVVCYCTAVSYAAVDRSRAQRRGAPTGAV
ncbi:hypothetical protein HMPREF9555_02147 [Selenomonas artemidis F0399]|uniref:Uncharacterized protein n=1 Tax=Selenomonas artemidis F0399 TaxID=749551 RepID=E7N553_9FIRM|nr:hypothetical protein HMPREF9555_02147 [Selenomonas artemidis F0399]